jgi:hypothetical protein
MFHTEGSWVLSPSELVVAVAGLCATFPHAKDGNR